MSRVSSPGSVAMPTVAELKGPQVLWVFRDSFPWRTGATRFTALAGARAGPHGHMMSPTDQQGGACGGDDGGGRVYLHPGFASLPQGSVSAAP